MSVVYKTFEIGNSYYVYDRNTNKILHIPKSDYDVLDNVKSPNGKQTVLEKYQRKGFLLENRLERIEHPINNYLANFEEEKVTQLILQVTQNCNLRCGYCYYVNEAYRNRHHAKLNMDISVAQKAMNYLLEHSSGKDEIVLGFYGGEPLLRFDLIKQCIDYMESNVHDRKILFTLTTNGTLLNQEIIEFFMAHNVALFISLDGTKETHDKNRKFADGTGSFDLIMSRVSEIKNIYPEYFKKIYFNTVINPEMDMGCVRDYYSANDILSDAHFTSSTIQEFYTDSPPIYDDRLYIDSQYGELKALLVCACRLDEKDIPTIYSSDISDIIKMQHSLHTDFLLPKSYHHGGPCIAGSRRLFVDVNGNFFPCERVSESSNTMRLGSLDEGFNIEKAYEIINIGKITQEECMNCWALVHCRVCAAWADDLNKFDRKKKLSICPIYKNGILHRFKNICALKQFIKTV